MGHPQAASASSKSDTSTSTARAHHPVDIVRALYGTSTVLPQSDSVLLATTSHFTKEAKEHEAPRYDLELKDFDAVLKWVNDNRPNPNGGLFLRDNRLVVPGGEGFSPDKRS